MDEWMDESWMDGRMTVWMGRWKGTGGSGVGKEWGGKEWNRGKGGGGRQWLGVGLAQRWSGDE